MKKILAFCVALTFASHVYAAPASTGSIEQVLVAMKVESMLAQYLGNIETVIGQSIEQAAKQPDRELTEKEKRLLEKVKQATMGLIREELAWGNMKGVYVQVYQDSFTQQEVDGLLESYKSPAGVALVNKMPLVMHNSMTIMQKRVEPMMQKAKQMIDQLFVEYKAEQAADASSKAAEKDVSRPKAKPVASSIGN